MLDESYIKGRNTSFWILWILYFSIFFSMAQIAVSMENIQASFPETTSFGIGLIPATNAFLNIIGSLLFGYYQEKIIDKYSRKKIIMITYSLMIVAFFFGALSINYTMFYVCIVIASIGTGAYGPVAFSMINDFFPAKERGSKGGLMSVGLLLGSGFGLGAGALFGNLGPTSWRIVWMIGPVAGVLYLILYNLKGIDPERGRAEAAFEDFEGTINYDYKLTLRNVTELFKKKYLIAFFLFQLLNSFSAATMGTWGIQYLTEFRFGDEVVATFFTICVGLFALPGSFLGGYLGDRFYRSGKLNMRIFIAMSGMIIGTVSNIIFYLLPLGIPFSLLIIVIMACSAMFFANLHVGNGFAMISEVCVPELRSSAHALNGLFVNLGNVVGNLIFSSIITADRSLMPFAIGFVYAITLIGSLFWILPYFQYPKDAKECDELMSERRKEIDSKTVNE